MSATGAARRHAWLELVQQSGPFLTVPVADRVWPTGLPAVPGNVRAQVRAAVSALMDAPENARTGLAERLFGDALQWDGDTFMQGADIPAAVAETVAEHSVLIRPDFAFHADPDPDLDDSNEPEQLDLTDDGPDDRDDSEPVVGPLSATGAPATPWRLLGRWSPWGRHPLARYVESGWSASPVERLAALLRARDVPLGLVSDGRWWALVWAPRGRPVGVGVWDATLWNEEPETFTAFVALLHRRRFLGVAAAERLPALLQDSADAQEEVTTALGGQVRAAVEMLVRRFDELNRHTDGALLREVSDDDLYAAVVTVMMRVVFLLFAEERRLVPSDDALYDSSYSMGRLVEQLEQRAAVHGEQTLEHRTGAWHRMLALARALHSGVAHEDLRLPPYGGGLFDPDRFPWLEGQDGPPPAVDDLTVLRMLEAVQYVRLGGERRRLTFRALDVEQIGYVYEGLLELEVRTATEPVLGLDRRGKKGRTLLGLTDALQAIDALELWTATTYLGEKKLTPARRRSAAGWLAAEAPPSTMAGLHEVLDGDTARQLQPLAGLIRRDDRDRPVVTLKDGRYVAPSTRRASTGAHYTPRSLAEEVVQHTLEPLLYRPGPLETLDANAWTLRPSTDILALRVADIAMGSGAFLVAACRFLADRVVEAWDHEGDTEASRALAHRAEQTADAEVEGVQLRARRLVAEHCLYGVDVNPLAVEMAKLSLWLVTMDRERPFGFLDDRLVAGDSLLGITSLAQLETLHLDPAAGRELRKDTLDYGKGWRRALAQAADTRRRITATPVVTVRDVEHKMRLLREAQTAVEPIAVVADAAMQAAARPARQRDVSFRQVELGVWEYDTNGSSRALEPFVTAVQSGVPDGKERRRPLHWPLVFPEVFADTDQPGFSALVGNPPFLGGQKLSGALGSDYLGALQAWDGRGTKGSCDLAGRFVLRADQLLGARGQLGYVTTNTLIEGDTLTVGLLQMEARGWTVRRGASPHPWPSSSANLSIIEIWLSRLAVTSQAVLDEEPVPRLGVDLQPYPRETGRPLALEENEGQAFIGSYVLGLGFILDNVEGQAMLSADPRNQDVLFPYVIGADLNRRPDTSASRWVINFFGWSVERASTYPLPFAQVKERVQPERASNNRANYRDLWWRYGESRPGLYEAISGLDHVLALSRVGNALLPVRVEMGDVFSEACVVFASEDFASLALLSSSVHQIWAIRYTSTMETRMRYAPSDVFLTLPRPDSTSQMAECGERLDTERSKLMLERALGLTKLYNQVHDPVVSDPAIVALRTIHAEIDHAVLAAYGWSDVPLDIGHHPTKLGVRWTVSPQARFELLDRLLVENHHKAARQ